MLLSCYLASYRSTQHSVLYFSSLYLICRYYCCSSISYRSTSLLVILR